MNAFEEWEKRRDEHWEKQNAAFQERMRQDEQERHHRESRVIHKQSATGLGEGAFLVQQLILLTEDGTNAEFYQPSLNDLGLPEELEARGRAFRLLKKLQKRGCIASVEISGNNNFTLKGLNASKLKKALRSMRANEIGDSSVDGFFKRWGAPLSVIATIIAIVLGVLEIIGYVRDRNIRNEIDLLRNRMEQLEKDDAPQDIPTDNQDADRGVSASQSETNTRSAK